MPVYCITWEFWDNGLIWDSSEPSDACEFKLVDWDSIPGIPISSITAQGLLTNFSLIGVLHLFVPSSHFWLSDRIGGSWIGASSTEWLDANDSTMWAFSGNAMVFASSKLMKCKNMRSCRWAKPGPPIDLCSSKSWTNLLFTDTLSWPISFLVDRSWGQL